MQEVKSRKKGKVETKSQWAHWKIHTSQGRQYWIFSPPVDIKKKWENAGFPETESGQKMLQSFDRAFHFNSQSNPNSTDAVYRSQMVNASHRALPDVQYDPSMDLGTAVKDSLKAGFEYWELLQTDEGNWQGDYGGPMFLLPGLIFVSYITDTPFELPHQILMARYMLNHQNPDGGWGMHIEGKSTMFGTVMQYVSLRILGEAASDPAMTKARLWIHQHGGATQIPPWGKFYLSILNLYEWSGNDSLFPELWILPRWLPFHPGRYWCHSRMVYLPMSYCYGHRIKATETELLTELRSEIHVQPYQNINWESTRHQCAIPDQHEGRSSLFRIFNTVANGYEHLQIKFLRRRALRFILDYIDEEDRETNYVNIGPVNQVLNSLCIWHHYGKESAPFKAHVDRWKDYLWVAEDGMKMNGYNGSQLWDAAFAGQALTESKMGESFPDMSRKLFRYLDYTQIREDPHDAEKYFRTKSKGG